ncbi:histidine kinase [Paucibacter sp. DJ1R-11]|uniref:histidine kinase n=1 Tax=Paucibacter sp. DJ1R-11 TaxID=2893556 RepID=UPI0021E50E4C|nr:histidine kinase [Paucibacter sp. DJ1R-11]MCV2361899.1 histidine kinase [Paucibacter sp. DJ1R-11]
MMDTERASGSVNSAEILLIEHSGMVGNIIVSTARQLGLPHLRLVNNARSARHFLAHQAFVGLIAALDDEEEALELIGNLRKGDYKSAKNTPVAITTAQCSADLAHRIKVLGLHRILIKPFKIRDLVITIETLTDQP